MSNQEQLDMEAMTQLGKTYAECNVAEKDAVAFAVNVAKIVGAMDAAGAKDVGELVEHQRKNPPNPAPDEPDPA